MTTPKPEKTIEERAKELDEREKKIAAREKAAATPADEVEEDLSPTPTQDELNAMKAGTYQTRDLKAD